MIRTVPFTKGYKNSHFLVSLLHTRGLSISNITDAEHYIEHIGYYRLSAYMYNDMYFKLRWLFIDFPEIDLAAMGFPKGWEMEPLWR